jgi:hypothetical protein
MRKTLVRSTLAALTISAAAAKPRDVLCFANEGLKEKQTIRYEVANNVISKGKFIRESYEEDTPKTSAFTGSKTGTVLVIEFKGKTPYPAPPKSDTIVWKLGKQGLVVPMYSKNYETSKWSAYDAVFTACKP